MADQSKTSSKTRTVRLAELLQALNTAQTELDAATREMDKIGELGRIVTTESIALERELGFPVSIDTISQQREIHKILARRDRANRAVSDCCDSVRVELRSMAATDSSLRTDLEWLSRLPGGGDATT